MLSRSPRNPLPGGGNRFPRPPEAFGGGGGGGRGDGDGLHGFQNRLQRYRLGLVLAAASIVMLFLSFTTLFVARREAGKFDPTTGVFQSDWIGVPLPMKILLINTAVLVLSTLLLETARRAARMEAVLVPMGQIPGVQRVRQLSYLWVGLAFASGCGFLLGQYAAWRHLNHAGITIGNGPASTFFFVLTGAHALHLAAGLVILLYACIAPGPRHSLERRSITLDVTAWYWHFMSIMWIYVLLVVKLMN
jgi:cytochrome c oxidase subunit III